MRTTTRHPRDPAWIGLAGLVIAGWILLTALGKMVPG